MSHYSLKFAMVIFGALRTGVCGEVGTECKGKAKPVEFQCKQHYDLLSAFRVLVPKRQKFFALCFQSPGSCSTKLVWLESLSSAKNQIVSDTHLSKELGKA